MMDLPSKYWLLVQEAPIINAPALQAKLTGHRAALLEEVTVGSERYWCIHNTHTSCMRIRLRLIPTGFELEILPYLAVFDYSLIREIIYALRELSPLEIQDKATGAMLPLYMTDELHVRAPIRDGIRLLQSLLAPDSQCLILQGCRRPIHIGRTMREKVLGFNPENEFSSFYTFHKTQQPFYTMSDIDSIWRPMTGMDGQASKIQVLDNQQWYVLEKGILVLLEDPLTGHEAMVPRNALQKLNFLKRDDRLDDYHRLTKPMTDRRWTYKVQWAKEHLSHP